MNSHQIAALAIRYHSSTVAHQQLNATPVNLKQATDAIDIVIAHEAILEEILGLDKKTYKRVKTYYKLCKRLKDIGEVITKWTDLMNEPDNTPEVYNLITIALNQNIAMVQEVEQAAQDFHN